MLHLYARPNGSTRSLVCLRTEGEGEGDSSEHRKIFSFGFGLFLRERGRGRGRGKEISNHERWTEFFLSISIDTNEPVSLLLCTSPSIKTLNPSQRTESDRRVFFMVSTRKSPLLYPSLYLEPSVRHRVRGFHVCILEDSRVNPS